jgi:hypothetical protein
MSLQNGSIYLQDQLEGILNAGKGQLIMIYSGTWDIYF